MNDEEFIDLLNKYRTSYSIKDCGNTVVWEIENLPIKHPITLAIESRRIQSQWKINLTYYMDYKGAVVAKGTVTYHLLSGREMYGSSEKEDALRYNLFVKAHGYTTNPCAEIILSEPQTCTLSPKEEIEEMKVENIIRVTYASTTVELSTDGPNDCAKVEALVAYAMKGMKTMQDRAAEYKFTAGEAGITAPANIIQNLEDREAEFAEILRIVGDLNVT